MSEMGQSVHARPNGKSGHVGYAAASGCKFRAFAASFRITYLCRMPKSAFAPCLPTRGTIVPAGPDWIHEIKHEKVKDCGSFEVWFSYGRPSRYFYFDDVPSRRLRPEQLDRQIALRQAQEFARTERNKLRG